MNNIDVQKVTDQYLKFFSKEKDTLAPFCTLLEKNESVLPRTNTTGHITASGILIYEDKMLLIYHNALQKYIQPGGHIEDADQSLWQAALREVYEETGTEATLHPWHAIHSYIPINIDTFIIPFNSKKQEIEHFHYDFAFIFETLHKNVALQHEEVSSHQWIPLINTFNEKLLDTVKNKIISLDL